MYNVNSIIHKRLDRLYDFNECTPLYFNVQAPIEILKSYDDAEIFKIIQFDKEIKNILEPFFSICSTARMIYENMNFRKIEDELEKHMNAYFFLKEIELLDILRDIAIYYEFIELRSDVFFYQKNLNEMVTLLKEILKDVEQLKDSSSDVYMFRILSENIDMLKSDIEDNKNQLNIEMKNILKWMNRGLKFADFSSIFTQYCLEIFKQDSLIDSEIFFNNIYVLLMIFETDNELAISICQKYESLKKIKENIQQVQQKLFDSQNGQSLI